MLNRYSRQTIFPEIGEAGQTRLKNSFAVVIGCGALGTVISTGLVRAGVGKVRIIDRDFIEIHNLQRQVLFNEDDIRNNVPKAIAAEKYLKKVNSEIEIEGIVSDVNFTNIEKFVSGANVILDGLDNFETRFLINDISLKLNIPWVYGGAIASKGMSFTVVPHKTACYRCLINDVTIGSSALTCDTAGVIGPTPGIVGNVQTAEALKILVGSDKFNRKLFSFDVWNNEYNQFKVFPRQDCPACQGHYEFLDGKNTTRASNLCGQNAVQILPSQKTSLSFSELAARLSPLGEVSYSDFMLTFKTGPVELIVFPDARVIVKNTSDETQARGLYARYIGN
jgi:molybdopterin-synthase adenylyltransferase